jgi:hypothetical protein
MDIKEYIESGIINTIVLGLASEEEQKEFEQLSKQYPELIEAKKLFELSLENQLIKEAAVIPARLKDNILGSFRNNDLDNLSSSKRELHIPFQKLNVWKLAAAACLLLLLTSLYFTYSYREKYRQLLVKNKEINVNDVHTNPFIILDPIVKKPSVKPSALLEKSNPARCAAHVYWDTVSANTYLLVGNISQKLIDKQLQLWAIENNQPISLGVFDASKQGQLLQMKNAKEAKMFMITIEQKGGSITPSMERIYAVGNL